MGRPFKRALWRVTITAHDVPPRWKIPDCAFELGGSEQVALDCAVGWALTEARVPPMKSLRKITSSHAKIERVMRNAS